MQRGGDTGKNQYAEWQSANWRNGISQSEATAMLNMPESQRAVVASRLANIRVGRNWNSNSANLRNKNISQSEAAAMLNMPESQRAVVASRLANMPLGGASYRNPYMDSDKNINLKKAAEMLNVSERWLANKLANMQRGEYHGNQYEVVSANLRIPKISQRESVRWWLEFLFGL